MAVIKKILRVTRKDDHVVVLAEVESRTHGTVEAEIMVGGEVELFFHDAYNKAKAVVKRAQSK